MVLSIHVSHNEQKPFTPGSTVHGMVKLTMCEGQTFETVSINFRGVTKVLLKQHYGDLVVERSDYVSESYLFSRHLDLYAGESIHQYGTYAWPFAFRIPLFAALRALPLGSKDLFYPKSPWKGDLTLEAHPLPPSMQRSGIFNCTVQYVLEATLVQRNPTASHTKGKSKKTQTSCTISVQNLEMLSPTRSGGDWPYDIYRDTLRLHFADSVHESIRNPLPIFSRKAIPPELVGNLSFSVLLPRRLEMKGQPELSIPVSCTMDSCLAAQKSPQLVGNCPEFVLYSFKLSLVQHIRVRAGCHAGSSNKKVFSRKGSGILPISCTDRATFRRERDITTSVNLCDSSDLSIPRQSLAADFSTYNIARFHTLNVVLRMKYRGKKHKLALHDAPLQVVPENGGELERRLSEGVEEDDVYGCDLTGIQWQEHTPLFNVTERGTGPNSGTENGENGDFASTTPPPAYHA